jgi:hypothetical protein
MGYKKIIRAAGIEGHKVRKTRVSQVDNGPYADLGKSDAKVVVDEDTYCVDDGNAEVAYTGMTAAEAADSYVRDGLDGSSLDEPLAKTTWENVWVYRRAYAMDIDGHLEQFDVDRERHKVEIHPDEPDCESEHDWHSPYSVVGGLKENPGVWGKGGGVICREVCANCGAYRITDTYAQDPTDGIQGLESIRYEDSDDASLEWVESLKD